MAFGIQRNCLCFGLPTIVAILLIGVLSMGAAAEGNLISNPQFLGNEGQTPTGWSIFGGRFGQQLFVIEGSDGSEDRMFMIDDESSSHGYGLRSNPIPAEPGVAYRATFTGRAENGGTATVYLDFWDENRRRIAHRITSTNSPEWEDRSTSMEAPDGAVWVTVILYSGISTVGQAYFKDVSVEKVSAQQWSDEDVNLEAVEGQLDYAPVDGAVVTTNPPSFVWIPIDGAQSYSLEYSTDENFAPNNTTRIDGIDISIYTPSDLLDVEATWYWRVRGVDGRGTTSHPTMARAFRISPDAMPLPLPPLAEVRERVPAGHPRLFATPETLQHWRDQSQTDLLYRTVWSIIRNQALAASVKPLPDEPPHARPGGVRDINLWRQYTITVNATNDMELLAFTYMLTGDPAYGEAARRWMLHIAEWDPNGATSWSANSENFMPILYKLSRAYTWAYDALTPEDRKIIQDVMRVRGEAAYRILANRPYESKPYTSHPGRMLGFLGEAAIAFLGEIPEAEKWFDYIVRIFYGIYPAWGGDPGGWAEGNSYWTSYINRGLNFVEALLAAADLNLYEKPFFRNTGMFKLYTQPPYALMGGFGDFYDSRPSATAGNVMAHFANVYENEYYQWYADQMGVTVQPNIEGYIRLLLHPRGVVKGRAPLDLPSSRQFPDIGWVAMHKRLGESKDGIQFMFKSSPYGSLSHSFADQNTFTLEAYETALVTPTGHRPWSGSNHHFQWTKTTQAHNGILVGGQGQPIQSIDANGHIVSFLHGRSFDYTAGDAVNAYAGLMDHFIRHVVYVRPDVFVIFDDIRTPQPEELSWLLHTYHEMDLDEETGYIGVDAITATLDARLWSSQPFTFSQTDEYAVPFDEPLNKPVQWHLTATTTEEASDAYFLAVLKPSKQGERHPFKAEEMDAGAGVGVRIQCQHGNTTVLFRKTDGIVMADGLTVTGAVGAWARGCGKEHTTGLLLANGTEWQNDEGLRFVASTEVDAELTLSRSSDGSVHIEGTVISPSGPGSESFDVTLYVPETSGIREITSGHTIHQSSFEAGHVRIHMSPGEHSLLIQLHQ